MREESAHGDDDDPRIARLAVAAKGGDRAALDELFRALLPVVTSIARTSLGERLARLVEPEDVAQIALLDIHRSLCEMQFKTTHDFLALVHAIVRHEIADFSDYAVAEKRQLTRQVLLEEILRRRGMTESALQADSRSVLDLVSASEARERVEAALRAMPPAEARLIRLVDIERRSFAEIGRKLDMSRQQVNRRHLVAFARLAMMLGRQSAKASFTRREGSELG